MIINKVSTREKEILRLVSLEYTTHTIAEKLFISTHTVQSHRKNLMAKLEVSNAAGLVRKGFENGLLVL